MVVGLCLDRSASQDIYIPTFHAHCLLRRWPTISLSLNVRLKADNGADSCVRVTTKSDQEALSKAMARMKDLALLPLAGECRLADFESGAARWLKAQASPFWPMVLEDLILVRSWSGVDHGQALNDAEDVLRHWPRTVTDKVGGVDAWVARLTQLPQLEPI